MTFSQITALDTGDSSDDDDRQAYYAGGAKGRYVCDATVRLSKFGPTCCSAKDSPPGSSILLM